MAENAVQTTLPPPAAPPSAITSTPPAPSPTPARRTAPTGLLAAGLKVLKVLASLRLTVILLALSMVLVFCGTLAQVDQSILAVVTGYFRSFYVWIPLQIFFPRALHVGGGFPFPGGWSIGVCLLTNLLAAHLVRFKLSWKRSGVLLIHAGLIVMMVGELVTGVFAVEGIMTITENQSSNYVEHPSACELAVIGRADPAVDDVVAVPASRLRAGGGIASPELPFDIQVVRYYPNAMIKDGEAGLPSVQDLQGEAKTSTVEERRENAGTSNDAKYDLPAAYVTFLDRDTHKSLGTWLVSPLVNPQPIEVDGKPYQVALRFGRTYKPYRLTLLEGRHDVYQGSDIPRNYSSKLHLVDSETKEDRVVLIRMNDPLRYRGEAFYQSNMTTSRTGVHTTGLQVVHNPGWLMPYFSCAIVSLGMLVHFGMNLNVFLQRRPAS